MSIPNVHSNIPTLVDPSLRPSIDTDQPSPVQLSVPPDQLASSLNWKKDYALESMIYRAVEEDNATVLRTLMAHPEFKKD